MKKWWRFEKMWFSMETGCVTIMYNNVFNITNELNQCGMK